ncbi:OmpH family outer membrane protein [Gracilimonas mengyeensis]|uniref:Periplasmic chaperone for outer membrane proteins Skp n=1 Tax=Gracilimonas mengyeensis TaxID=1302730 RepID=A0A521EQY1_9BACT|nr:OmpH family outer membrane protein [Gracilimonas mengyeensis]SMO86305.1 periplasmic chaperone for outer membrane proteins Skp [Gracilimonas mengyeensis]
MKKRTIFVTLFLSLFLLQGAFAQVKIGYTNPARVLSQLPEVEEVDQQIQQLIEERDAELAEKATNLQQVFSDYEASMNSMTEEERGVQEQELMQMNQQFEEERSNMMNEIRQRRQELMAPIIERMNTAMAEVAEEQGLDLILNEGTSYGDAIIFYAGSERLNVTEDIIEKLK